MQHAANVTAGDEKDWHAIDWKRVYRIIKNLRQRIFRASREGDLKKVRSLQRLMLRCRANVLESVRRVTQVNQGKYTPGVDKVLVKTPEARAGLCQELSRLELHKVHPVRRVYSPDDSTLQDYWRQRRTKTSCATGYRYRRVFSHQSGICPVCHQHLENGEELHFHHVVPKKLGGTDDLDNLRLVHY